MGILNKILDLIQGNSNPYATADEIAAEERWTKHNQEAKEAGCKCGAPATRVQEHHGTIGRVPHQTWTCQEHYGATGWTKAYDGPWIPEYDRPSPCHDCTNQCGGTYHGGKQTAWACPTKPQEGLEP